MPPISAALPFGTLRVKVKSFMSSVDAWLRAAAPAETGRGRSLRFAS